MGMGVIEEKCRHDEATSMSAAAIVNALTDQAKRKKKKKKKEEGSNGNSLVDKESEITPSVAPSSDAHSANVPDATGEPEPAVDETTSSKKKKKKKKRLLQMRRRLPSRMTRHFSPKSFGTKASILRRASPIKKTIRPRSQIRRRPISRKFRYN